MLTYQLNGLTVTLQYWQDGLWHELQEDCADGSFRVDFRPEDDGCIAYTLSLSAPLPSKLRLMLTPSQPAARPFHLIPCNIYGDNNAGRVRPGGYPLLTSLHAGVRFASPVWELRADRAAMPVSILCTDDTTWGVSVEPYAAAQDGSVVRCGVVAELPASFGVTLGYTNRPRSFENRQTDGHPIGDSACEASVSGRIYRVDGLGRQGAHRIIRAEYTLRRDKAVYHRTLREAADALFDTFVQQNWNPQSGEYTNQHCRPKDWTTLRPWRNVIEIGWTGGAILALPMLMYEQLTPGFTRDRYCGAMTAEEQFNRICSRYNEKSGMIYDLMTPNAAGSDVNGWWAGIVAKDCHCAYNSGTAVHALLYAADFLRARGERFPALWVETAEKVLCAAADMQREDGAFGYAYALDRREVVDWDGFAGCWFAAGMALLHRLTGDKRWLSSAMKAMRYYTGFVRDLNCWGAPMDTWKAVDQEGNLAFVRAASILWQDTHDPEALEMLRMGAEYEYLWRYGYRTRPEHMPIKEGWTACGGSVTSVSNPHIHPMGVLINADLLVLADATGDDYHRMRSEDGTAWLMQTLELYPDKTGYGRYGVLSERWCPSDGLLIERYADGSPYSSWFSYNLWAAANALQAVCEHSGL